MKIKYLLLAGAGAAILIGWLVAWESTSHADSIVLRNQSTIHGKARKEDGKVIVQFGTTGEMAIPEDQVLRIIENDLNDFDQRPEEGTIAPAADAKPVVVTLKPDKDRLGNGQYIGWEVASDDEGTLALRLPGGGILRLPREYVASVTPVEERAATRPAIDPSQRTIQTTHIIHLEDGRKILGNVVEDVAGEPLKVEVGDLGIISIRRGRIAKIEEKESVYEIAPSESASEPPTDEEQKEIDVKRLKEELKREILREILEAILEEKVQEKIDRAIDEARMDLSMESAAQDLTNDEIQEILHFTYELTRQRTTNRVRAENALKRLGPRVLPYLENVASHPFDLTRRAVQRIVQEIGDVRGVPYAIDGLTDPDPFVREIAAETLREQIGPQVAYSASASPALRQAAQERYREIWVALQREHLQNSVEDIVEQAI